MKFILLGAPGVGKSTYGRILAKYFGISFYCLGNIIRSEPCNKLLLNKEKGKLTS